MRRVQRVMRNGSNYMIHLPAPMAAQMGVRGGDEIVVHTIGDVLIVQSLTKELQVKGADAGRVALQVASSAERAK